MDGKTATRLGYSDTPTFTDAGYQPGTTAVYRMAGYVNGACIGSPSLALSLTTYGDTDKNGSLQMKDALLLLRNIQNGSVAQFKSGNVDRILKVIAE